MYKEINLELASEYLLNGYMVSLFKIKIIATCKMMKMNLKHQKFAEKLKLQLKKLELIRLLSDQLLKKERLGDEIRMRGM